MTSPSDRDALDTSDARNMMVDGQVRPNKVYDPRLLAAMRAIPREKFLPARLHEMAYTDADVPLGRGRVMLQPMVIGRLVESARPRANETVLVVGAGAGYGAALLAACGASVVALEDDPELLALSAAVLPETAPGVVCAEGPLQAGWADAAPYDVVMIEGGVGEIPAALVAQLKPQGRLLALRGGTGRLGMAVIGERTAAGLSLRPIFDCAVRMLPAFAPAPTFTF